MFALHATVIALLLQQATKVAPPVKETAIAVVALDAERPAAAKPPPPTLPAREADAFNPLVEFSIPSDVESDAPAGASGPCSTAGAVLDALLVDPDALAAIRNAPPETRSIAQAVVIWNEGWSPAAVALDAPLGLVRDTIERTLAAVAGGCLDEPIAGPRLLPIPDGTGEGTMFLVIGSGSWRWRHLVTPPPVPGAGRAAPAVSVPAGTP